MSLGSGTSSLFDAVRYFAYSMPRGRGGPAMYAQWGLFIQEYAEACNGNVRRAPLSHGDVAKTARSVAQIHLDEPQSFGRPVDLGRWDSDVQRRRSRLGVEARRRKVLDRNRADHGAAGGRSGHPGDWAGDRPEPLRR